MRRHARGRSQALAAGCAAPAGRRRSASQFRAGRMARVAAAANRMMADRMVADRTVAAGRHEPWAAGQEAMLRRRPPRTSRGRSRCSALRRPGDGRSLALVVGWPARPGRGPGPVGPVVEAVRPSEARPAPPRSAGDRPGSTSHPNCLGRACAVPRANGPPSDVLQICDADRDGRRCRRADRVARPGTWPWPTRGRRVPASAHDRASSSHILDDQDFDQNCLGLTVRRGITPHQRSYPA
jgi:hypothetical protein